MEHKVISDSQLRLLEKKKIMSSIFAIYKYNPSAKHLLGYYTTIYKELKNDYYPKVIDLFDDEFGTFQAYSQEKLKGYQPIKKYIESKRIANRDEVIKQVRTAIDELLNYGIYYFDIHNKNILWNGNKIKLVDIDGASLNVEKYLKWVYFNLVDFILELYIYYPKTSGILYVPYFLDQINGSDIFSKEFLEYLQIVKQGTDITAMKQIDDFLTEIQDDEKTDYIIRNYIQR